MPRDAVEEPAQSAEGPSTPSAEPESLAEQATLHAESGELDTLAAAEVDWQGREIQGRYRVGEKLGEGGMGMVYAAEHIHLRKQVAFKVIHPNLAANEELLARFTREALATGQLEHPHICAAIDFERLPDGAAFLVMPFVRGHSLQAELDSRGALPWRLVCRYGAQIADALSAAHAVGIVHRDLKPDNVLIERRPDDSRAAKVLDFGVASLTGAAQTLTHTQGRPLTQAGMILGTPGYMSPEQATAGEIDGRSDLYALGVILWELTAGQRLFDAEDITHIFAKQFRGAPDAVGLDAVGPARELAELTMQLLSTHKEQRPRSAAEVRDQLQRLAEAPEPGVLQVQGVRGFRLLRERWQGLSEQVRLFAVGSGVALLSLLVFALLRGDDTSAQQAKAANEAAPAAGTQGTTTAEPDEAEDEAPQAQARDRQTKPRERAEAEAEPSRDESSRGSLLDEVKTMIGGLPDDLEQAQTTLFEEELRRARVEAAQRVVDYHAPDDVPEYLRQVAEFELARGCRNKRSVARALIELADPRARPLFERLDGIPQRGCGLLNLRDCYGCLRREVAEGLEALQ